MRYETYFLCKTGIAMPRAQERGGGSIFPHPTSMAETPTLQRFPLLPLNDELLMTFF